MATRRADFASVRRLGNEGLARWEPPTWTPRRRYLGGTGLRLLLCSPGIAFIPVVGPVLALIVFFAGLAGLFSFQVFFSGACPFCEVTQVVPAPHGVRWGQIRRAATGVVFGADCVVCRNRMIVRIDDRVAIPCAWMVANVARLVR